MARKRVFRNRPVDGSSEGSGGHSQDDTDGNETEPENHAQTATDQQEQNTNAAAALTDEPVERSEHTHDKYSNESDAGASTSAVSEQQQLLNNEQLTDGTPPLPKRRKKDPSPHLNQDDNSSETNEASERKAQVM